MARQFDSLPPELILRVAESEVLNSHSLSTLLRVRKYFYVLLWRVLYRREIARNHPVGFIRCIRTGSVAAVSKFISAGVDVNRRVGMSQDIEDFQKSTYPLATAVLRGRSEVVDLLLREGANVEPTINSFLCYAVLSNHPLAGIPRNTAFSAALALGHENIAIRLVQAMKDPNSDASAPLETDYTPLELAARCLQPKVVRQLLERGTDPNKQGSENKGTVLHVLLGDYSMPHTVAWVSHGQRLLTEVITVLLEYGADPFTRRPCLEHSADRGEFEECRSRCRLTACTMGLDSPYLQVRQLFRQLAHRQLCDMPACRASRGKYRTGGGDIPGHCHVGPRDKIDITRLESLRSGI